MLTFGIVVLNVKNNFSVGVLKHILSLFCLVADDGEAVSEGVLLSEKADQPPSEAIDELLSAIDAPPDECFDDRVSLSSGEEIVITDRPAKGAFLQLTSRACSLLVCRSQTSHGCSFFALALFQKVSVTKSFPNRLHRRQSKRSAPQQVP